MSCLNCRKDTIGTAVFCNECCGILVAAAVSKCHIVIPDRTCMENTVVIIEIAAGNVRVDISGNFIDEIPLDPGIQIKGCFLAEGGIDAVYQ